MPETHLQIGDLHAQYGESQVLHGMALTVGRGEVVTLLGRNGAGKTTTLRAIMGLLARRSGSVRFEARELMGLAPEAIARAGIALCPEERAIFSGLSVQENLMLPPVVRAGGMTVPEILALFPNLAERLKSPGTKLSGGEQQMLAIGRILRTGATLLLLDEPSEGLAPVIIEQIGLTIRKLKDRGISILLVEQNVNFATSVADRHYVVEHGEVIDAFSNAEIASQSARLSAYLSV
ncbi:ABC transporter ATP-binding protein [Bordetella bronchiseptica]|uniref:ABC transporter ATP-binding protein n=1 Tax=Bordetella bronchiseptica TaxID=518 RepID=UPI00028FB8BE|nr:ABC transporter ATP-binding protein [Bordetella bronchiseptica]KCV29287.1 ABC transporter, ATP-binding protein [Bordetella bronchiseptica 00-P-2730]KDD55435.1 ABC transporter, ATP-binding protein [Bordetella bronchiseptica OSU553]AUL14708.1 ABC transporter ATP-binding protein [Bordetella bronchiseptica]AWQ04536.1 ABC transporter ATP-binding protein [Bordetella bronchiseptica]AZW30100.1 ABC transporter ATP-binding protein [Bordetella bronchiseptica]